MTTTHHAQHAAGSGLSTAYSPQDHETRIRERWEAANAFHADPSRVRSKDNPTGKPPYCVLIPPPNVTGALHLGHALNNTLQDILVRMKRMQGFEVLWMPGTDHAGIATQTVVEKRILAEGGKPRIQWDRDEFIGKVREWKDEYQARITNQLTLMGSSCDWDRQRFTMDDVCAKAVREAFFQLFKAGLIERGKRPVNWDPVTQTALADDEVDMIEVEGKFYYLRYPLCDDTGAAATATLPDGSVVDHVTVATTRPETYLGDTAVAVNPKDPRAAAVRGLFVKLPIVGRKIPIIEDDYVVLPDPASSDAKAKYATGFLKVTPAHDNNDWHIGLRHDLKAIDVMSLDGKISDQRGWNDVGDAAIFVGLSREDARQKVVEEFEKLGLLDEVKPYTHSVGHSYRSHAAIETLLSDQWYVKVTDDRLAGAAQRAIIKDQQTGHSKWLQNTLDGGTSVSPVVIDKASGGTGVSPVVRRDLTIHERNLPHWQRGGSVYFVTFRLKSSELDLEERSLVADACAHWHGDRAAVHLFTVMPNHVHMLIQPREQTPRRWWPLQDILQSIKSYTAHAINKKRNTTGPIWQSEYFDRIVRDEDEYRKKWQYMTMNPVKMGIVDRPEKYAFTRSPQREKDGRDARPTGHCASDAQSTDIDQFGDGAITFHPDRYAKTYEAWHENLRDWCVSRQLWWGHRIPVWSFYIAQSENPDQDILDSRRWLDILSVNGIDPKDPRFCTQVEPQPEGVLVHCCIAPGATDLEAKLADTPQDPDVLDTWFSSALWPLSTLGWPDPGQDEQFVGLLDAFKPTSVLCTARDIITLWVSRMVMFNRFFADGQIPFHDVYIHPVIQDGDGKRMSKSAGNGVDPLDIIHTHGADAMRYTLCQLASQTQDVRMPVEHDEATDRNTSLKFDLGKKFCNKLWNASRFTLMMLAEAQRPYDDGRDARTTDECSDDTCSGNVGAADFSFIDRWMLSRLTGAVERIENALGRYEFNTYAEALYDILWNDFCDWHLEAIKPTVKTNPAQQAVLRAVLDCLLRLLHPVAPFVTEAIFEELFSSQQCGGVVGVDLDGTDGRDARPTTGVANERDARPTDHIESGDLRNNLLCLAPWPKIDPALRDEELELRFSHLQELARTIRDVRSKQKAPPKKKITLHTTPVLADQIAEAQGVIETLAHLEAVTTDAPAGASTSFTFDGVEHRLSGLADETNPAVERNRLTRSLAEADEAIALLEKRLSNPGYVDKAPAKLVAQTRDQLESKKAERDAIARSIESLA